MVREVEHLPTQPYRHTPLWRRVLSLTELGAIGVVLGALLALLLAVVVGGGFLVLDRAFK